MSSDVLVDRADRASSLRQIFGALFRYRELVRHLVAKDLKLKYRRSVLGFLWSLLNPLIMVGIYTIAFDYIMHMAVPGFVFYLLLGMLAWTFFSNSLMMATGAVVDNWGLVKSVYFPRAILPVATVLFNFAQYVLTAVVFLPLMLIVYHVPLSAPMLAYPVFLVLQLLFTIGLALLIATATTFFLDLRHFLEIALQALIWLTPIIYLFDSVPEALRPWLRFSPMSPFILAYHEIFFYRRWPDGWMWGLATTYAAVAFVAGLMVMLRYEDRLSEQL